MLLDARLNFFKSIPEKDWQTKYAPMAVMYNQAKGEVKRTPLVAEAIFALSLDLIKETESHFSRDSKNNQPK